MYKVGRSRTPQGVRGLKPSALPTVSRTQGRTPQGVRGLKRFHVPVKLHGNQSHSARSAWIETPLIRRWSTTGKSHSARSAWIET